MRNVVVAFSFISIGGLLFGLIIGVTSNILSPGQLLCRDEEEQATVLSDAQSLLQIASNIWEREFQTDRTTGHNVGSWTSLGYQQCYKLAAWETGFASSLSLIGAVISSLFCFGYADSMGRRLEVQVGAVLYFFGALIVVLSPCLAGIFFGLLVYGLGIGFAMHVAPIFVGEIAPAENRGGFIAAKEAIIVSGMVLGFFVGFVFENTPMVGWRYMVVVAAFFALIMGIGIRFVPDSPRWLALHEVACSPRGGVDGDAAAAALNFYRSGNPPEEIKAEMLAINDASTPAVCSWHDAFSYPKPLFIGCGLVILQQVTGQPALLYYATSIFRSAGLHGSPALDSLGLSLVKLVATITSAYFVDRFGRRPLLFLGISLMAASLATTSVAMGFRVCHDHATLHTCPVEDIEMPYPWSLIMMVALTIYVSGYQIGFGPISWLMVSEVFPLHVRGAALSVAAVANFSSNIFMTLIHPTLQSHLGPATMFSTYSLMCIVSLAFVWQYVPETRHKSLEEINKMLEST